VALDLFSEVVVGNGRFFCCFLGAYLLSSGGKGSVRGQGGGLVPRDPVMILSILSAGWTLLHQRGVRVSSRLNAQLRFYPPIVSLTPEPCLDIDDTSIRVINELGYIMAFAFTPRSQSIYINTHNPAINPEIEENLRAIFLTWHCIPPEKARFLAALGRPDSLLSGEILMSQA